MLLERFTSYQDLSASDTKKLDNIFQNGITRLIYIDSILKIGLNDLKEFTNLILKLKDLLDIRFKEIYFFNILSRCCYIGNIEMLKFMLNLPEKSFYYGDIHFELYELLLIDSYSFGISTENSLDNLLDFLLRYIIMSGNKPMLKYVKSLFSVKISKIKQISEMLISRRESSQINITNEMWMDDSGWMDGLHGPEDLINIEEERRVSLMMENRFEIDKILIYGYLSGLIATKGQYTEQKDWLSCLICQEKCLQLGVNKIAITRCNHFYHEECLENWMKRKKVCCIDRKVIDTKYLIRLKILTEKDDYHAHQEILSSISNDIRTSIL